MVAVLAFYYLLPRKANRRRGRLSDLRTILELKQLALQIQGHSAQDPSRRVETGIEIHYVGRGLLRRSDRARRIPSGVRSVATVETVVYAVLRDVVSVVRPRPYRGLDPAEPADLSFVYGASVPIVVLLIMIVLRGAPF